MKNLNRSRREKAEKGEGTRGKKRKREGERVKEDLLPCLEDGFDVGVEVLSGETSHLEAIVDCVSLLQLHDLLGQLAHVCVCVKKGIKRGVWQEDRAQDKG